MRDQVLAEFKREHFDDGLEAFSRRMSRLVKVSDARPVADKESASALVERNRIRLTLAGAKKVQEAAEAKATEMKVKVNIAIVDDGGHLLSFARMDGARPASATTAMTKAVSAATFRQPSGPLGESNAAPDVHLNLSIQNAATASGGKITTLPGGIPIIVDDQVIGAIGVGGGTALKTPKSLAPASGRCSRSPPDPQNRPLNPFSIASTTTASCSEAVVDLTHENAFQS